SRLGGGRLGGGGGAGGILDQLKQKPVLYIGGAVAAVLLIVLGAILLTHHGSSTNNNAGGNPSTGASTGTSGSTNGGGTTYTVGTPPAKILKMKLSPSSTTQMSQGLSLSKAAQNFESKGYGKPSKLVSAVYYLPGHSQFIEAAGFSGFYLIGFDGQFNPDKIISAEKAQMINPTTESPGPHGGQMVCGIGKTQSGGKGGSVCIWVTKSTFVVDQYYAPDERIGTYPNMYATALKLRNGFEQPSM